MKVTIENKVSMYYKVREFFANHLNTLADGLPALSEQVARFQDKLTVLDNLLMQAGANTKGYAKQKQQNRSALTDAAMTLSGAMVAHAKLSNDEPLVAKCSTARSTLERMRDTDFLYWCDRLRGLAVPHAAEL